MESLPSFLRSTIRRSPVAWASACGITLRPYQRKIALAVKDSILRGLGLTFIVILPRQSGKNELQAHLFSWLLYRYSLVGGSIVAVAPTFKPQTLNSMDRVARSLSACIGSRSVWKSTKGFEYQLGLASLKFFSGGSSAKAVGATASLLLAVDEAQEIPIAKFDKDFDPMTASTNGTRFFAGTRWTTDTLLEREYRFAMQAQKEDGIKRVFFYTADDIIPLVPKYGEHVERAVKQHGRNNPRIRSQYFCEAIDAQSTMFNPARLSLIISPPSSAGTPNLAGNPNFAGTPPKFGEFGGSRRGVDPQSPAEPSTSSNRQSEIFTHQCYSFLLDVAGQDESALDPLKSSTSGLGNPGRDSTCLTIVRIDLSTLSTLEHPTYHVEKRYSWVGQNHTAIFGKIKNLYDTWHPQHIVIDATGVGEGLWGMLDRHYHSRVIPVKFTQPEKSEIGWKFLSIIETGRFRDHCHTDEVHLQYTHCIYEILPGPAKTLRWGVPDGARGPEGSLLHDDYVLADSLVAKLDQLEWHFNSPATLILPTFDPLESLSSHF